MKQRIITATILIAFVLVVILLGGVWAALAIMGAIALATWEEYQALRKHGHRTIEWPVWGAAALSIPLTLLWGVKALGLLLVIASMSTVALVMFRKDPKLEDALVSLLPLFTIVLPGLCLVSVSFIEPRAVQRIMLSLVIAVPVLGDTFALFVGSYLRGPKLCPAVSPNKTISGAVGGLIGSLVASGVIALIAYLTCKPGAGADAETLAAWEQFAKLLPHWWTYVLLGLLGGVAGQLGDLFASMVKRHCGIKDFSNIFPGHGGMLDRMDSILFMAIIVFCVCVLGSRFV